MVMKKKLTLAIFMAISSLFSLSALSPNQAIAYHKKVAYTCLGVGTLWAGIAMYYNYSAFIQDKPNATFAEYVKHLGKEIYENKNFLANRAALVGLVACAGHGFVWYNTVNRAFNGPPVRRGTRLTGTNTNSDNTSVVDANGEALAELALFSREMSAQDLRVKCIELSKKTVDCTLRDTAESIEILEADIAQLQQVDGFQKLIASKKQKIDEITAKMFTCNQTQSALESLERSITGLEAKIAQIQQAGSAQAALDLYQPMLARAQADKPEYERKKRLLDENPPHFYVGRVKDLLQQSRVECGFYAAWFTKQFEKIDINVPESFSEFIASVSGKSARAAFDAFFAQETKRLDKEFKERLENPPDESFGYLDPLRDEGSSAIRYIHDFEVLSLLEKKTLRTLGVLPDIGASLLDRPCVSVCRPQTASQGHWVALGVLQVPTGIENEYVRVYIPFNSLSGLGSDVLQHNIVINEQAVFSKELDRLDGATARQRPQTVAEALKTYDATMDPDHKAFLTEVLKHLDV